MNINGFKLPAALEANLRGENYKMSPAQTARLKSVLSRTKTPDPELYNYENILRENEDFWTSKRSEFYLGTPSLQHPPGNVDPKLTLFIGDAEPDSPIALDYRTAEPRVIYLCEIDFVSYWVELSSTYAALMKMIGAT